MHRFTRDVDAMGSGSEAAAVTARRVRTCTHAYEEGIGRISSRSLERVNMVVDSDSRADESRRIGPR